MNDEPTEYIDPDTGEYTAPPEAEDTAAPAPAAAPKRPPRAKYTEAFMLRCTANRDPSHPSVLLLTALANTATPHKGIDMLMGVPDGTVQKYLITGEDQRGFGETEAFVAFDMLLALVENGAFTKTGLSITGVLLAMKAFLQSMDT